MSSVPTVGGLASARPRVSVRVLALGALGVAALATIAGSWIEVPQNEVASITRFGRLDRGPLPAGPHFKLPWIEHAYSLRISEDRITLPDETATTIDNQFIYLKGMTVTFHVAVADANKALFGVGGMGSVDIIQNAVPVIRDRTLRVLGRVNTIQVNQEKDQIAGSIMAESAPDVLRMFGVTLDSIQLPSIDYDERFKAAIGQANEAKMRIIQAQAQTQQAQQEALRATAAARGQADAQIEAARGAAESQRLSAIAQAAATEAQGQAQAHVTELSAQANADTIRAAGEAQAAVDRLEVTALGGPAFYVQNLQAQAMNRWTGGVPQMVFGGDKGPQTFMPLPLPLPTQGAPAGGGSVASARSN